MKTFYSAADIEELASQGLRELAVGDETVLTALAREAAAQLGIRLLAPGRPAPTVAARAGAAAATPLKPRGCQHGPAAGGQTGVAERGASGSTSGVVDDLIGAVKQLAKRG